MKHIIKNFVLTLVTWWVLITPIITFAQEDKDCSEGFWSKCYVSGINTIHTKDDKANSGLLDTIRNAINWIMGILATITLCICLYAWFQMLISWTDSKWYDNWMKTLKNALLWLAIILLSWMIVSAVFRFVWTLSWWNQTQVSPVNN